MLYIPCWLLVVSAIYCERFCRTSRRRTPIQNTSMSNLNKLQINLFTNNTVCLLVAIELIFYEKIAFLKPVNIYLD